MCFGARDNSYGSITTQHNGEIISFRLVYLRGQGVSCSKAVASRYSYWGCDKNEWLATFLTDDNNAAVFPRNSEINRYQLPGIRSDSTELTFNNLTVPLRVATGQEFRVWYVEDLKDNSESDNGGQTCMDVYALYV